MTDGRVLATVTTLEELAQVMADRRQELGLPQLLVDEISGVQGGYTAKIEAGIRGLGKLSLPCLLGALGLRLHVVTAEPHPVAQREVESRQRRGRAA